MVWWWSETAFVTCGYLSMPVMAWYVRTQSTEQWAPVALAALLVCVMIPLALRVILMEIAFFDAENLSRQVRRFAPAIRFFTASHAILVALWARQLGPVRFPFIAPALWMVAAGILAYGFVFEPIVEKAAFRRPE